MIKKLFPVLLLISIWAIAADKDALTVFKSISLDFESESTDNIPTSKINSVSGTRSLQIPPEREYSCELTQPLGAIPFFEQLKQIDVNFQYHNITSNEGLLCVIEIIDEAGKSISWNSEGISGGSKKEFQSANFTFILKPEFLKKNFKAKFYFWNNKKANVLIDDLKIKYKGRVSPAMLERKNIKPSSFLYDLENNDELLKTYSLTDEKSHSGSKSSLLKGKGEYSVVIQKTISDASNGPLTSISASVWILPMADEINCSFVCEIKTNKDKQIIYKNKDTRNMKFVRGKWNKLNAQFNFNEDEISKISQDDKINIYLYNLISTKVYADDFFISIGEIPSSPGFQTYVEINNINESYYYSKENPPYPFELFSKQDILNSDTQYLINTKSFKGGDLKPHHQFLTGHFTTTSNDKDQLLVLKEDGCFIYSYCDSERRFFQIGKVSSINSNSTLVKGDFMDDGKDEVLTIYNGKAELYNFNTEKNISCADKTTEISVNKIEAGALAGFDKIFAGKFLGNKKDQLLLLTNDFHLHIKEFSGNRWMEILDKKIPGEIILSPFSHLVRMAKSKDEIILVYKKDGKNEVSGISISNNNVLRKTYSNLSEGNLDAQDELFSIGREENSSILAFNFDWRFYMRSIGFDETRFYVKGISQFNGYKDDQNPKYYECIKIIPGRFNGKENLLCILYNCADKNYEGGRCQKYDSISDLPNSIQLYNIGQ